MKSRLTLTLVFSISICMIAFIGLAKHDSAVAAQASSDKIEAQLADQIAANGSADYIVRFTEQADLSPAYSMDWVARGEFVYNTLSETAARSQVNAKAILDAQGLAYQTFIAGNDLYVYGGYQPSTNGMVVLDVLAALPEVSSIRATKTYHIDPIAIIKPLENVHWVGDFLAYHELTTVGASTQATIDWGITDTKADQAWSKGARGSGIKVASIDTGVQWNHPALINQFACPGNPSDPKCWKDPSNICGGSACDNVGHGTHTMGTMIAKDNQAFPYIAGMAPDATWIACKGCEGNSCSSLALNTCADWILAPGGNSTNRPNVVNNSWGGDGGDTWFQAKVQAWVAAGIFPAFSAGNSGEQGCSTLGSPGDYQESFASAAHDTNRSIAYFSSRGPSAFGHTPYTKPNISAPGVSICSTVPTNGWNCGYSGTSMASPHTAGAVAQLWSCAPSLVGQVDATFQALQNSAGTPLAGTCGAPPDGQGNYTYGYGYLDVLNLVSLNCGNPALGTLQGHVYDQYGDPIVGATVTANAIVGGTKLNRFTDLSGFYTMKLIGGSYSVTASKAPYTPQTINSVVIVINQKTTQDFKIYTTVSPSSFTVSEWPATTMTLPLTITNLSSAPLNWSITEVPGPVSNSIIPTTAVPSPAPHQVTLSLERKPGLGSTSDIPSIPASSFSLYIDDGSYENSIGVNNGIYDYQFIWFNRFSPSSFPFILNQIEVLLPAGWGVKVGDNIDLVVYQDADGNPSNGATWLATYPVTVQYANGTDWSIYNLPSALFVSGPGDVLIGVINRYTNSGVSAPTYPASVDTDISQGRSWVGIWNTDPPNPPILPPNSLYSTIDSFGLPGNLMIRGIGENNPDVLWLSESPTAGIISPGESFVAEVTFNSTGLVPGRYLARLYLSSNDPVVPVITIPVSLLVIQSRLSLPYISR